MYVIKQNAAGVTGSPQNTLHPADRCTFMSANAADDRGYDISAGMFYPGNAAAVDLGDDITLGYMGKSGRFVPISN